MSRTSGNTVTFGLDWHQVTLPVIQEPMKDATRRLVVILRDMLILNPLPQLVTGESADSTLQMESDASNFAAFWRELLEQYPGEAYKEAFEFLRQSMPDLKSIQNLPSGKTSKSPEFVFPNDYRAALDELSDGEKCLVLAAYVNAWASVREDCICLRDEPDNHISLSEVQNLVIALRRRFNRGVFLLATSHREETIRRFSTENTLYVFRNSHSESTLSRWADSLNYPLGLRTPCFGATTWRSFHPPTRNTLMAVNRYEPHLIILPEGRAYAEIATGFKLEADRGQQTHILPEAGG